MARKSLKSNKARITKEPCEVKAAQAKKPLRATGIAFCLGALFMAGAFVLTPLGDWCFTHYEPTAITVTKCDHKPQGAGRNRGSRPPDPETLARLAQGRGARDSRSKSKKAEKRKDPMAELRRIEAINAQNRRLMEQRTALPGHRRPQPTAPQPHYSANPRPSVADTRR